MALRAALGGGRDLDGGLGGRVTSGARDISDVRAHG